MAARRARIVAVALFVAVLVGVVAAPVGAQAAWRYPIAGTAVVRPFDLGADPFEGGRHRGVDLAARAGVEVRAPCDGPVVVAGVVGTSGRVVTIRCGPWRVSHMPLGRVAVRRGAAVRAGTLLGTAASSRAHAGLHFGVRREGDRFGYVDPTRFLAADRDPPPILGRRPSLGPRPRVRAPIPRAAPSPLAGPRPRAVPSPRVGPLPRGPAARGDPSPVGGRPAAPASNPSRGGVPAPWPAWVGLALVLGASGARWRVRRRWRRASARGELAEGVP